MQSKSKRRLLRIRTPMLWSLCSEFVLFVMWRGRLL